MTQQIINLVGPYIPTVFVLFAIFCLLWFTTTPAVILGQRCALRGEPMAVWDMVASFVAIVVFSWVSQQAMLNLQLLVMHRLYWIPLGTARIIVGASLLVGLCGSLGLVGFASGLLLPHRRQDYVGFVLALVLLGLFVSQLYV